MGRQGCERRKTVIFCKIIEESIINDRKLMIPEMFVKKYGNELRATAILRVINGAVWQVGLNKLHNKLWFCNGWSEFMYHHCIHAGSFLVFAYHGDSTFDVYVCDLMSREIRKPPYLSYPKVSQYGNRSLFTPIDEEDDDVVEILSSSSSQSPAAPEALAAGGRLCDPQLLDKLDSGISMADRSKDPPEDRVLNPICSMSLQMGNVGVEGDIKGSKRSRTEVSYSQGFTSSKVRAIKSPLVKNLEIFYAPLVDGNQEKLSQSKFTNISVSAIPASAQGDGTNYGSGEARKSSVPIVEVKKSAGSIRLCGLIQDAEITENGRQEAVKPSHQHIKDENMCVKERTSRSVSKGWRAATTKEKERALLAANMYVPSFAYYRVVLQPSYISKGTVRLSNEFASTFLNGTSDFIFLEISSGERWRTRCICREGYAKLSSGWSEFVRANQLMEGDVCVFEVIKMKNVVLKVSIFRALEDVEQHGKSS